jgi:hypothetical protein
VKTCPALSGANGWCDATAATLLIVDCDCCRMRASERTREKVKFVSLCEWIRLCVRCHIPGVGIRTSARASSFRVCTARSGSQRKASGLFSDRCTANSSSFCCWRPLQRWNKQHEANESTPSQRYMPSIHHKRRDIIAGRAHSPSTGISTTTVKSGIHGPTKRPSHGS